MAARSTAGSARSATIGSAVPPPRRDLVGDLTQRAGEVAARPRLEAARRRSRPAPPRPRTEARSPPPIPRLAPVTIATLPVSAVSHVAPHPRLDNSCEVPPRRFRVRLRRGARRRGTRITLDIGPDLDERDALRVRDVVAHLLQRHDTATQRADVIAIAEAYGNLSDTGRVRFFMLLTRDFWTDPAFVDHAIATVQHATEGKQRVDAERSLRAVLTPPTARLLRSFTELHEGVKFLVDLRADNLRLARNPEISPADADALEHVGLELKAHLSALFDVGLLDLRRITWVAPAVAAREDHRVRGGAHDPLVGRPEEPARLRPALLRVLPPVDARRAARVRRDRVDDRHRRACSNRCSTPTPPTWTPTRPTPRSSTRSRTASPGSPA